MDLADERVDGSAVRGHPPRVAESRGGSGVLRERSHLRLSEIRLTLERCALVCPLHITTAELCGLVCSSPSTTSLSVFATQHEAHRQHPREHPSRVAESRGRPSVLRERGHLRFVHLLIQFVPGWSIFSTNLCMNGRLVHLFNQFVQ